MCAYRKVLKPEGSSSQAGITWCWTTSFWREASVERVQDAAWKGWGKSFWSWTQHWSKCTGRLSVEICGGLRVTKPCRLSSNSPPAMEEDQACFFLFMWRAMCATMLQAHQRHWDEWTWPCGKTVLQWGRRVKSIYTYMFSPAKHPRCCRWPPHVLLLLACSQVLWHRGIEQPLLQEGSFWGQINLIFPCQAAWELVQPAPCMLEREEKRLRLCLTPALAHVADVTQEDGAAAWERVLA